MTTVLSSSPHKSSQPCSSTRTNRRNGELFPKEEPKVEKEEEEDDDDDDVSLLAAAVAPEPEAGEEEDDYINLLDGTMVAEPETKQHEEVVDYLEGMTAEMFGDYDDFDRSDSDIHNKEEEVEPLPDAHYGLLGSSKVLREPQGCIDDLSEEVLRQVLCLVPAQDLYRNLSLVCHHWRNIIQDPKVKQTTASY